MTAFLSGFLLVVLTAVVVNHKTAALDCPPGFRLGQTYHEVQQGPCPSIDSAATFISQDSSHVGYLCAERRTMVVGDRRTGKMDAFFLVAEN